MKELSSLLERAAAWRGSPMAIATVVRTWGSAPRSRGSQMLVLADGRFEGSVSGGCVEGDVLAAAISVIAGEPTALRTYGVADEAAWEVGLPCGGEIDVLIQPVDNEHFSVAIFDAIADAQAEGRGIAVSTDLTTGQSSLGAIEGQFVNHYKCPRRLLIVGAVQIAQSLARLASELDYRTTVVDPRGRFLTAERFPDVVLDDRWPDEAIASFSPDVATAVVTLSHDAKIDDPALIAALALPTGYVAALGSRRSHAARLARLEAKGLDPASLARIEAPAGLDIGAVGPAEIALSIAASMTHRLSDRA